MKMNFLRRLALLCAVLTCGMLLALPAAAAEADAPYAEDGDMDYIRSYVVTVDPREDGSADITYDIDWQVIDGDKTDYLSWVKIGLANSSVDELTPLTDTISDLQYTNDGGSYAKVVFRHRYYAPDVAAAEAGVNHNGSLEMAKEMARVAKECGADIVKYQTAVPELVVSKFAEKAEYQKQTTDAAESQLEMIRKLHFSFEAHKELKEYCDSIGIQYLSAPFDVPSVKFLGTLGLPLLKIPSGEITNLPYLEAMAALKTPVLLSTGMSTLDEITDALGVLDDGGCPEVTILHCNTQYPTPYEDANLTAMIELYDQFGLPVGLSDHTPGWECDVAATVMGAQVIEEHFTLDKSLPGPDQKASLDPAEFAAMVLAVRHAEAALGDGHKHLTASEAPNKAIARKSIVAAREIKAGEVFTEENLTTKRPGDGISPMRWHEILGQTAKRDFAEDEKIEV